MHLPVPHLNWLELHVKASVNDKNYRVQCDTKTIYWHYQHLLLNLHFAAREHRVVTWANMRLTFNWKWHKQSQLKATDTSDNCEILLFA